MTVHQDDAYARLHSLCRVKGWSLELATLKLGMELRVVLDSARVVKPFKPGAENHAAKRLLADLKAAA